MTYDSCVLYMGKQWSTHLGLVLTSEYSPKEVGFRVLKEWARVNYVEKERDQEGK